MHIHTCAHTHRDSQTHTHTHAQRASGGCIVGELLEVVCKVNAHLVTMFTHTHTQTLSHTHTHTQTHTHTRTHTYIAPLFHCESCRQHIFFLEVAYSSNCFKLLFTIIILCKCMCSAETACTAVS